MKAKILMLCGALFFAQNLEARISILSPLGFQERGATPFQKLDQSISFQNGWSGVSPSGNDRDASFMLLPYQINYGIHDKFEIGASWGLEFLNRKDKSDQFGIHDLAVAGRYRFFDADRAERTAGLDAEFGFAFPTASFEKGLGTGAFGVIFGWGLVLPLDPVRMQVGMGYRLNTENSDDTRVGHVFSYNVGASYPLNRVHKDLTLLGELKGLNHGKNKFKGDAVGSPADELYLAPGASYKLPKGMRVLGQVLIGLTPDASDAGFSIELQF